MQKVRAFPFVIILGFAIVIAACTGDAGADVDGSEPTPEPTATSAPVDLAALPNPQVPPPINRTTSEVVKVTLIAKEVPAKLDDGVGFDYWTFGGTVPGDMIRVREGDTIELTLKNDASNKNAHNIDLHAVNGPGGGGTVTLVQPGEEKSFRFQAQAQGLYVYHCATPVIPVHIMQGMYGMILVEPAEGLPPVDKEFYVMQGELYLEGTRQDKGMRSLDFDEMLDETPDYVVFNGRVGSLAGEDALKAEVGDDVRIFFGVGGPNLASSFHVIGEIFDKVHQEGATESVTNVQTTFVPAGGATMVEFNTSVPGAYILVDHSLGRLLKGAAGFLEVEGDENPDVFTDLP